CSFFFSSRRRHTRSKRDWSSDVCSSDLTSAQLGLTEGDVLGLAAAMSSVGIEAEAGGTAMSMGMKKIDAAVREGGDSLAGFAEVAGMTNEEFSRLWSEDSAQGLDRKSTRLNSSRVSISCAVL